MNDKNRRINKSPAYAQSWSQENAVKFFSTHRNSITEVYNSEKHFLSEVLESGRSVLDLGCAAGGFYNVFRELEPSLSYTGIDISEEMIKTARAKHPEINCAVSSGSLLPFKDQSFDVVFCSGALHMTYDWLDILNEGWRVTKKYFVFDVRLVETGPSIEDIGRSYEKIAFFDEWDGKSIVPYIILNVKDFLASVNSLVPVPGVQKYYGYSHPVSQMTVSPVRDVCMTMCCFVKNCDPEKNVVWDLPIKQENCQYFPF
ncbi:MAG: class I SAM-dependent methyltransferase [Methanoregula sp.]